MPAVLLMKTILRFKSKQYLRQNQITLDERVWKTVQCNIVCLKSEYRLVTPAILLQSLAPQRFTSKLVPKSSQDGRAFAVRVHPKYTCYTFNNVPDMLSAVHARIRARHKSCNFF